MFNFFLSLDRQRQNLLKKATHPVMQEYYETAFPNPNNEWDKAKIVALDFETTGLDPKHDQIISYGMVEIEQARIKLGTSEHHLIQLDEDTTMPESSAVIHHITDDHVSEADTLEECLPRLLKSLSGRVMLVHYNKIEQGFLNLACQRLYNSPFLIPTMDTLILAQRVLSHRNHNVDPSRLRLFNLRNDFKLPNYKAHNAFCDALTTAELFLALESEISPTSATKLKDLLL